jgi:hypothetical protein
MSNVSINETNRSSLQYWHNVVTNVVLSSPIVQFRYNRVGCIVRFSFQSLRGWRLWIGNPSQQTVNHGRSLFFPFNAVRRKDSVSTEILKMIVRWSLGGTGRFGNGPSPLFW